MVQRPLVPALALIVARLGILVFLGILGVGTRAAVSAQSAAPPAAPAANSRLWITAGGGFTSQKNHCGMCTTDPVYRTSGSLLIDIGARVNDKMDAAVELFLVPSNARGGYDFSTTFVMGIGQYRPLTRHGLFFKGGMGMGRVRNWVYDAAIDVAPPVTSNGIALTYGGGWEFRPAGRVGLQFFASHSVVALGDLETVSGPTVENLIGNFWTVGASIVIR